MSKTIASIVLLAAGLSQLLSVANAARTANIKLFQNTNQVLPFYSGDYAYNKCFNTADAKSMVISVGRKSTMLRFNGPDCKGKRKRSVIRDTKTVSDIASKYGNTGISFVITRYNPDDYETNIPVFDYLNMA
ncbi:hypothetical protein AYI69_g5592 [Smittium culicis]|uniref:LysM domain-containing protein n=2 Tax=Smittium culicis TaxID=133412 RepID=A0A1R1Y5D8_9FUNG|nr:hypothetical protein AYI69_g5592 [Smittium culicis]